MIKHYSTSLSDANICAFGRLSHTSGSLNIWANFLSNCVFPPNVNTNWCTVWMTRYCKHKKNWSLPCMHTRGIMTSFLFFFTGWIWLIIVLNCVSAVCVMLLPIGVNCPQRRERVEGTIPPHLLLFLKTKRFNEHLCSARWRRRKRKG